MSRVRDLFGKNQHDKQRRDTLLFFLTEKAEPVPVTEMAEAFNWSPEEVTRHLAWLRRDGLVRKMDTGVYAAVPRWPPSVEAQMRAELDTLAGHVSDLEEAAGHIRAWLEARGVHVPRPDDDGPDDSDGDEPY